MKPTGLVPNRRTLAGDAAFALVLTGLAVAVHVGGGEAVAANRPVGVWSVALTVLAVAPLALRRWFPVGVLAVTTLAVLVMVASRNTVGLTTLGPIAALYTAVAYGSRPQIRLAGGVTAGGILVGALLRPVDLSAEGTLVNGLVLACIVVLGAGVRQRREAFEVEVQAARERAALSAAEERLRITRELHDIVGHALGVMVVQAGVAEELLASRPEEARRAVAQIGATGRASLADMRQVLGSLRDDEPHEPASRSPLPGLAQLPELVARVEAAGLPVRLEVDGDLDALPDGLGLAAYRVVQEALTNCLKHSHAGSAQVTIENGVGGLVIRVLDDGTGADPSTTQPAGSGHGLPGMRERVAVFGGELEAGPRAGGGWRIEAVLPTAAGPG